MKHVSFLTPGNKRIQIVDRIDDVSADADYFIYMKDAETLNEELGVLMYQQRTKVVTKEIAQELIEKGLLWKNPPF